MGSIRKITRAEEADITRRLLSSMPASRFEMDTLCRLAGIKLSRKLPTAAVECTRRPRLLINPDFVSKHCTRDEHLFLLVMHELWHVQLAHTRMYPNMTTLQNIALDAVINSGLMREFHSSEYWGFFDELNPADKFPSCLLRPPEGWPYDPQYPEDVGPPGTTEIIKRLYPPGNMDLNSKPMYEEVLALLLKAGMQWFQGQPVLLGNHDQRPINDPLMKDFMKQVTSKWPNFRMEGRGNGGFLGKRRYSQSATGENTRRVFAQTLRICLGSRPGRERRKARVPVATISGNGVLPNARDRMAHARRQLGAPQTLWAQPGTARARMPEKPARAFVYLDVSGSMYNCLPYLLGLITPYVANKQAEVFQFSTIVTPLPYGDLKQGLMTTTGGTNINPVLKHLVEVEPKVDKVLILTDGAVGMPQPVLKEQTREYGAKMHIVLPAEGRLHNGMKDLVASVVQLPPL